VSFVRACAVADVEPGKAIGVTVGGQDVAVTLVGEEAFAIEDQCSHALIALSEGDVSGCEIECFLHGSRFDMRTGKPTGLPATIPVATFAAEVRGEDIYVDPSSSLNGVSPQ
jgi:3-phenylpropionate/trans-cinnamate dioxygenase ferredoxin subunit